MKFSNLMPKSELQELLKEVIGREKERRGERPSEDNVEDEEEEEKGIRKYRSVVKRAKISTKYVKNKIILK